MGKGKRSETRRSARVWTFLRTPASHWSPDVSSSGRGIGLPALLLFTANRFSGRPSDAAAEYFAKAGVAPGLVIVAQGQTEDAALAVLSCPGDLLHRVFVVDGQQHRALAVVVAAEHVSLIGDIESADALGDGVLVVADLDSQLQPFSVSKVAIIEADELAPIVRTSNRRGKGFLPPRW